MISYSRGSSTDRLKRALMDLKPSKQQSIIRGAMNKALTPVVKKARKFAPRRKFQSTGDKAADKKARAGKLYRNIGKEVVSPKKTEVSGRVGFPPKKSNEAWYAHFVIFGTKRDYVIPSRKKNPKILRFVDKDGDVVYRKWTIHPGIRPNNFLDKAFYATYTEMMDILGDEIWNRAFKARQEANIVIRI